MLLYSTNNKSYIVTLRQAVMQSLAPDRGLFMPTNINPLPKAFFDSLYTKTFSQLSFEVARHIIGESIDDNTLQRIIEDAVNFPAPVIPFSSRMGTLELWHGPSLAFKDFGARFMSRLMSSFIQEDEKLTILVATSGDTGGAVAYGFLGNPNIDVVILYPSGKVSPLQEKQLTTLGKNIKALEVKGTFDDCQSLVKRAFLDINLNKSYNLSSANSINIARLIPQTFYYFEAYKQFIQEGEEVIFSVPSGNFGNLTAGLLAQKMGLPVRKFIAATNVNKVVPQYLSTGVYTPQPSIATISNAMDVGNPSNFARMQALFDDDYASFIQNISGYWYDDETTRTIIRTIKDTYNYTSEPHGALAYQALTEYLEKEPKHFKGIFLGTAHPAKFKDIVESEIGKVEIPERLAILKDRPKQSIVIANDYQSFTKALKTELPG